MLCSYPVILGGRAVGCGQCLACRVNKRRIWAHRIMLEASLHGDNSFVTLSYSTDHMPDDYSLRPADLCNYLKRLRFKISPLRIRYFAAGEYGEDTFRPHYHLVIFGLKGCLRGVTQVNQRGYCCENCSFHAATWGLGNVYLGEVSYQSAAYCAGYTVKKWTGKEDEYAGRYPEFARMSKNPGLGAGFMDEVASTLMEHGLDATLEDVPTALRHGKVIMPLGQYLTRRLRKRIGRDEKTPQSVTEKRIEELRPLREAAFSVAISGFKEKAFREAMIGMAEGKRIQIEARERRRRKTGI